MVSSYAKQEIAKQDNCYIVEGYTDVIQLHQKGIKNVVSSSGTALSVDQITLIRRLTSNITMLFDGDKAGIDATLRGIDIIFQLGLMLIFVHFQMERILIVIVKINLMKKLMIFKNQF